ncbi:MAG TPA: DNA polymerase [Ilumatobacteraceae bacterium]|nr:DNA polymerase [Ilumatobacteraceae bacterium]
MDSKLAADGNIVEGLRSAGFEGGGLLALALAPGVGLAMAMSNGWSISTSDVDPAETVRAVEETFKPRWVLWGSEAEELVRAGVRVARCWNLAAVHRLLVGGWRADPARVWADLQGLESDALPALATVDLFTDLLEAGPPDEPVRSDGHLHPEWLVADFEWTTQRLIRWAQLAAEAAVRQEARLASLEDRPRARSTARSESAAELLCAELSTDGLPMDRQVAEDMIASFVGPRPRNEVEASEQRRARDSEVLRHSPNAGYDLRNPAQVKSMLRGIGVELPDTRAWRLEAIQGTHPLIDALLEWRKAERIATTFGYGWLDDHLGADGRLRGAWSGSDGAAGRMTASAGLHNMPANLRSAIVAEAGHVFVRADLGQIEPRILAAVSGDASLAKATADDDLYLPVATQLGVDRATAKVAVLGAMYGQTTGHGAVALRGLESAYPVAMRYLKEADLAGQVGRSVRTFGGRLIRTASARIGELGERDSRSRAAGQGRYARNAMVQGAAAEFFKVWAANVRLRSAVFGARIVLCLHDELLVHAPAQHSDAVAALLSQCLVDSARQWAPDDSVRFVADVSVIQRWSDAKP